MNGSIPNPSTEPNSLRPGEGWHCSHFFYRFNRAILTNLKDNYPGDLTSENLRSEFCRILDPDVEVRPQRLQVGWVAGHKADFSLMMMDPDPRVIESVHQNILASPIGVGIDTTWSYVSISEVSEYAQTVDQYAQRLVTEGCDVNSSEFETKLTLYQQRLEKMNYQRLTPDFPTWPVSCFYPMNKWRLPTANWFNLPASERHRLMLEHARSGIKFGGKVSQLITTGIGLDDWEWGVTLWATNPVYLKQIVYEMRFDEASAKYAEFGPFFTSYLSAPEKIWDLACLNRQ